MHGYPAVGAGLCAAFGLWVLEAVAQNAPLEQVEVAVAVDSGFVRNATGERAVIYATVLRVPDAMWLRLTFEQVVLGEAPPNGQEAVLRVSSLADGAVQTLTATGLKQWRSTSAYFNGEAVRLELIADPKSEPSRLTIKRVLTGPPDQGGVASICGPTDDRVPSNDPRAARAIPVGCTVWIIGDASNCFLTAGHCSGASLDVIEFNVPESDGSGNIQHPGPEDQYAVDIASKQLVNGGIGNDWGYFGCFANTETGLTPFEAQGDFYVLAETPPPVAGQTIRITGYGVDSSPPQWNQTQQTHTGPYVEFTGTTIRYQVDTQGGNSGSAVVNEETGEAIGIHTHGGCDAGGGANNGTGINNTGLWNAMANPQGICIPAPPLAFAFPDGLPELLDPAGDAIRVEVTGQNDGTPQPGTGMLHYDIGSGFVVIPMDEVASNVYDAIFPPIECGTIVDYFFSAETTAGEVVTNPLFAPTMHYSALSAVSVQVEFEDDFETDAGWVVGAPDDDATTGIWVRVDPNGTAAQPEDDHTPDPATMCFVTGQGSPGGPLGENDVDGGKTTLTSPIIDLAGTADASISYWRWYSNDTGASPNADVFVVDISNDNGGVWTNVETVGPSGPGTSGGWFFHEFVVSDFVTPSAQVRLRFIASDEGSGSLVEAAVDDFSVRRVVCVPLCPADLDGDGVVGPPDLAIVLTNWGKCPAPCPADLNGDGVVGPPDLATLLTNWGPCP